MGLYHFDDVDLTQRGVGNQGKIWGFNSYFLENMYHPDYLYDEKRKHGDLISW